MPDPMPELSPFYPKWIDTPDNRRIIVNDEEEEAREMSVAPVTSSDVNMLGVAGMKAVEADASIDERAPLRAEAESLGIKVDGRWSPDRLRAEIKKASDPQ